MGYSFDLDDVAFLRSRHGEKALDTVAGLELTPSTMLADITEVRSRYAPHDAALIETVQCRRRARSKLRDAEALLLTDDALQQATASVVAAERAHDIAAVRLAAPKPTILKVIIESAALLQFAGPDTVTFPVKVYSMVRFSVTPKVNAISTLLLLFTVVLTFIALRLQARAEAEKTS